MYGQNATFCFFYGLKCNIPIVNAAKVLTTIWKHNRQQLGSNLSHTHTKKKMCRPASFVWRIIGLLFAMFHLAAVHSLLWGRCVCAICPTCRSLSLQGSSQGLGAAPPVSIPVHLSNSAEKLLCEKHSRGTSWNNRASFLAKYHLLITLKVMTRTLVHHGHSGHTHGHIMRPWMIKYS